MSDKSYEVDFGDSGLTGAEEERLMRSGAGDAERAQEAALRPKGLAEFVGQKQVREQLSLVLDAAKAGKRTPDHVLLSGPPGLGKTTLAMIIAEEMGSHIRITSGPAVQHAGDLAAILSSLDEGEVLFIDEIHRVARAAEEMLYVAMEDFRVDVIVGKGPGATAIPLDLPPFTLVGPPPGRGCCLRRCVTALGSRGTWISIRRRICNGCLSAQPACWALKPMKRVWPRLRAGRGALRVLRTDCCGACVTGRRSEVTATLICTRRGLR